ncbi:nuclear transport factor 2 family protein [Pseudochelatococcus sp. B33]
MPDAAEILKLEREYWRTMAEGDHATSAKMLAERAVVVGSEGTHSFTPDEYRKMADSTGWEIVDWRMSEERVVFPTPASAVVTYRILQTARHEGKELRIEAWDSTVWLREGDSWKCILHTESPIRDARQG